MRHRTRRITLALPLAAALIVAMVAPATATPRQAGANEIVVGQLVTETSPQNPGQRNTGARRTLAAWAKMVNAKGGLNGAKVVIKAENDEGDPAKASSAVKDMIDEGIVAIVGNSATNTFETWTPIAKEAGVPVIGGGCYSQSGNSDENFFCVTTTAILDGLKAQVKLAADQGAKSFGITYASDIPAAAAAAPLFKSLAGDYDVEFTDAVGTTNTQPDYTAACITFKQSGTTDVGIEGAPLLQNLARDCGRQNYFPKYTSGDGQISQNSWLKDPNIKEAIAAVYSFPYMLSEGETAEQTKSLQEWQSAMKKYAPDVLKSDVKQPATVVWTAAKAFEAAVAGAGTVAGPADVKRGLYTFKDQTLGGLAPNPITFTEGQEHPHNSCWFYIRLKNSKLTAPDGMKTTCTP
jgi:branched-chain amino acid transport system substrate-binding protein